MIKLFENFESRDKSIRKFIKKLNKFIKNINYDNLDVKKLETSLSIQSTISPISPKQTFANQAGYPLFYVKVFYSGYILVGKTFIKKYDYLSTLENYIKQKLSEKFDILKNNNMYDTDYSKIDSIEFLIDEFDELKEAERFGLS